MPDDLILATTAPPERIYPAHRRFRDHFRSAVRPAAPVFRSIASGRGFAWLQLFTLTISFLPSLCLVAVLAETIWKPLPYPHADQLFITETAGPILEDMDKRGDASSVAPSIRDAGLFATGEGALLTATAGIERLKFAVVSKSFMPALGPPIIMGSIPAATEVAESSGRPLVISERLWRNTFGGARKAIGQSCILNGLPARIYGVVKESDMLLPGVDAWLVRQKKEDGLISGVIWYKGLIRLQDGSSPRVAAEQIEAAAHLQNGTRLSEQVSLISVANYRFKDQRLAVKTAAWVAGFLFLIGLVNSVSLYCSELLRTQRDIAVKLAIGSSFWRLVWDIVVQQQVYAVSSWFIAALLCPTFAAAVAALEGLDAGGFSHHLPTLVAMGVGLAVLMVAGAAIAVAQLWIVRQVNIMSLLQEGSHTVAGARRGRLVQNLMLFVQVGMSTALLTAAGHLTYSYWLLAHIDLGLSVRNVLVFDIQFPKGAILPERRSVALTNFMSALHQSLPAVGIGAVNYLPLDRKQSVMLTVQRPGEADSTSVFAGYRVVRGDYFSTLSIPILKGRAFQPADDRPNAPCRMIVNATLVRQLGIARHPVGTMLQIPVYKDACEVIGISADVRYQGPVEPPIAEFFLNYSVAPSPFMTVAVRSSQKAEALLPTLKMAARNAAAGIEVSPPSTMRHLLDAQLQPQQNRAVAVASITVLAILLTQLGLYGLVVRTVLSQARRIGIEMALGASNQAIVRGTFNWLIMGTGSAIAAGIIIALVGVRRVIYMGGATGDFTTVACLAAVVMILISISAAYIALGAFLQREPTQVIRWSGLLG